MQSGKDITRGMMTTTLPLGLSGKLRQFYKDRRGSTVIEFAFVFPIYLAFIFGIIELSYILYGVSSMNYAASYGSRYAFLNKNAPSSAIVSAATDRLSASTPPISFTATTAGSTVTINGTLTYTFYMVPISPITITTQVQQTTPTTF